MEITILPADFSGDPEALAMLQAFYSRSLEPIKARIERLGNNMASVKKALSTYYIGYGHNSIGDCGNVTLFIEGVSIIAAKEIQDNPLYNGQECSTRYIELSGDGVITDPEHAAFWWQREYHRVLEALTPAVRATHPFDAPEGFDVNNLEHTKPRSPYANWLNATAARAFDIARGWIPTNALTNLSLTCSLRTAREIAIQLHSSDLVEIRQLGDKLLATLVDAFPFAVKPYDDKDEAFVVWTQQLNEFAHMHECQPIEPPCWVDGAPFNVMVEEQEGLTDDLITAINTRPRHGKLPIWVDPYATFTLNGYIDYGTWRDMQRHRRNIGRPPVLRVTRMHEWYLDTLTAYLGEAAAAPFLKRVQEQFGVQGNVNRMQTIDDMVYGLPLGTIVPFNYTLGLAQAFYFAELRSGNTVHAILRPLAQSLASMLEQSGFRVDYDTEPARFDVRRGQQTIVENGVTA